MLLSLQQPAKAQWPQEQGPGATMVRGPWNAWRRPTAGESRAPGGRVRSLRAPLPRAWLGPAGARRSSAHPAALRPTSCPRSHLAAARSLSKWPPGPAARPAEALAQAQGTRLLLRVSFSVPGVGGVCAGRALGGPSPAGFAAGARCFRRPGEAWDSRCVRGRRGNLCLSSHRTGSESERPGPGPELHCGVNPVPGQPPL